MKDMGQTGPNRLWLVGHTRLQGQLSSWVVTGMKLAVFSSDQIAEGHFPTFLTITCGLVTKFSLVNHSQ